MSQNAVHSRIALILGAGSLGAAAANALQEHGWRVRSLHRHPDGAKRRPGVPAGIEWMEGDAMEPGDVGRAAQGVRLIVHALNPPRYQRWRELAIPMLAHSIEAAAATGARIIFPGNIYNFGPDAGLVLAEDSPQHPSTRKGAVRAEMESLLRAAVARGVPSIILRSGDYFGPYSTSSWFGGAIVKPGQELRSITYPGPAEAGHAWAYLPDLAETLAQLADREAQLPAFATYHFQGHWLRGHELVDAIRRAAGRPDLPVRRVPWPLMGLAAPFSSFVRELLEMRYLWETPYRLDNGKLVAALGEESHTPLHEAVRATLASFKCLPA